MKSMKTGIIWKTLQKLFYDNKILNEDNLDWFFSPKHLKVTNIKFLLLGSRERVFDTSCYVTPMDCEG